MKTLAIIGGKPLAPKGPKIAWPQVTAADVKAVSRVAQNGKWWRYDGDEVSRFEGSFARFHDAKHCLGVVNGTVAIEVALKACGIEPGDEVIVPSVTFIASASAVLMAQAVPVFADILEDTCQIDPADVEKKVNRRTKAILVVHYGGYPVDMDAIKRIARKHSLRVIEDCAHAQGSQWRGRGVGAIGDIGTFSFQQSKSLTCGEGGAVVTNSRDLYENAYAYHHIGRSLESAKYEHSIVGPNYRITEFQGAVLRTQLAKLPRQVAARMANLDKLREGLGNIPGIKMLKEDSRITRRGMYFAVLRFDKNVWGISRDTFVKAVVAEGPSRHWWVGAGYGMPVYNLPAFKEMSFGKKGCPLSCGHYKGKMDYSKVVCPAAEKVSYHQHITIDHNMLLHAANTGLLLRIIRKVWKHRSDLQ